MSTSGPIPPGAVAAAADARVAGRFRASLLVAMAALVCAVTGVVLFVGERNTQASYEDAFQQKFQSQLALESGLEKGRQAAVKERCRLLARSVRIRAALSEGNVQDLYENALIELQDVLETDAAPTAPRFLHANFVRFLDSRGRVLSPNPENMTARPGRWEQDLAAFGSSRDAQQEGYVAVPDAAGRPELNDVIGTPVIAGDTGEKLGTMLLGFAPTEFLYLDKKISSGILLGSELYLPGKDEAVQRQLAAALRPLLRGRQSAADNFQVPIDGVPHLVFYNLLNRGPADAPTSPAYRVSFYPLAESIAQQRRLLWEILGIGGVIVLGGLAASYLVSWLLSRPVEELAADSAAHRAGRQEAEAARQLTEQKYRSIFENAVEGIFLLSAAGSYLRVNPAMARMYGYGSPEELVADWTSSGKVPCRDRARYEEFLRRVEREGVAVNCELEMTRLDGRDIWVSQSARAVRDAEGRLVHYEGTLLDISENRRARDELKKLNEDLGKAMSELQATQQQVIQQERLRALGQMASGIAHDFNNALMPITGFSELLLSKPEILQDAATAHRYLEIIHTGSKDAGAVVGRLREFYRPNETSDLFGPVMLGRLAKQAAGLTRPKWKDQAQANGADIHLSLEIEDSLPVKADESAMRELLTNLIFNAVDAMPKGGSLTLRARTEKDGGVIEVSDTGTGMTEEVRKRCLEPFYSTKGERGTGLGLSMVFGIVQRHQGLIDIDSRLGRGTTIRVRLPLHEAGLEQGEPMPETLAGAKLSVLVVDDEPQVREVLSAFLMADGHECQTAGHALEGIHRFQERPLDRPFDLVIVDKAMPGMSGEQMARAIKQISPATPVVLLTGFGSFMADTEISAVNVLAAKPITRSALREAIGKALEAAA